MCVCFTAPPHLILFQTALLNHLVTLLLEGDDDQSHEDVHKEEREDHKVNYVENRHLHSIPSARPHVLLCHIGGVLQDPGGRKDTSNHRFLSLSAAGSALEPLSCVCL